MRARAPALVALLVASSGAAAACANRSYAGLPLRPGAIDEELRGLALLASSGSKQAQLELGIRFEQGDGVAVDLRRAERLYRRAARPASGTDFVHAPAGPSGRGQMIGIYNGPDRPGLAAARARLERLVRRRSEGRR